jgi:hypothetical protein
MAATIPTTEPSSLRAGDTWAWTRTLDDYPAPTWTLKYRFKNASTGFEIVATASGSDHAVSVAASTTSGYTRGDYTWVAWVESGAEKYTVDQGNAEILVDYRTATVTTGVDDRSHAKKTLDAIEAVIEGRATKDQMKYTIATSSGSRTLELTPYPDLVRLHSRYSRMVAGELAAERLRNGLSTNAFIGVRF